MKTFEAWTLEQWRAWLTKHHDRESEVWLIFHKRHTGKESIAYTDALDEALIKLCSRLVHNCLRDAFLPVRPVLFRRSDRWHARTVAELFLMTSLRKNEPRPDEEAAFTKASARQDGRLKGTSDQAREPADYFSIATLIFRRCSRKVSSNRLVASSDTGQTPTVSD